MKERETEKEIEREKKEREKKERDKRERKIEWESKRARDRVKIVSE